MGRWWFVKAGLIIFLVLSLVWVDNLRSFTCLSVAAVIYYLQYLRTLGGSDRATPHMIQAYLWPALIRGMEVVAVTDAFRLEGQDGVSLSYLLAIASLLFDVDNYKCLPSGSGVSRLSTYL